MNSERGEPGLGGQKGDQGKMITDEEEEEELYFID